MELLKQPQYSPYDVEDQVVSIWAGTNGYFDDVDLSDVRRFERELLDYVRRNTDVVSQISSTGKFEDETEQALRSAVRSEEHTSELQSRGHLVCRLLLEKKKEG